MRPRPLLWFAICLLCLAGAWYCWRLGDRWAAGKRQQNSGGVPVSATNSSAPAASPTVTNASVPQPASVAIAPDPKFPHRFRNTTRTVGQLSHDNNAVILENALIDSTQPTGFIIPEHLRAAAEPGAYIIKLRVPLDVAFHAELARAAATFISYVPNDAVLVRATEDSIQQLKSNLKVSQVYPWEPVYKLKSELLALGMENRPLPEGTKLSVVLFNDLRAQTLAALEQSGAQVLAEERSPFGSLLTVNPPSAWTTLAQLPGVQLLELSRTRAAANDLTRERIGVADDSRVQTNYLGLTGQGVIVNINDSGVDASHPDLVHAAVIGAVTDTDGHGTHVAGIIAGDGTVSTTVSNAYGSIMPGTNFQFRGMAPQARLFAQIAFSGVTNLPDHVLQERAALTNALISNNSWGYPGANVYDIHASSFDQAVRDSLPDITGSQPVLFVFAAGNEGNGEDGGRGGSSGSVISPGTAKNSITVGASELPRSITNQVVDASGNTNAPWEGMTSSRNEIAWFSSRGNTGIGIEGDFGRFKPDVVAPGTFVISARSGQWDTNAYYAPPDGSYWDVFRTNLNDYLGDPDYYRYESGTSMAAPAVSGMLALIQEFFEQKLQPDYGPTRRPSPALMKALVINGARSVGSLYDFQVANNINYQGWGLVRLQNSIPYGLTNGLVAPANSIKFFDQSPQTALATGQSVQRTVHLSEEARTVPLRITLVWTDPPGNPAVGIKLVNDLDLVVTNLDTQEVFYGNDIQVGSDFVFSADFTNAPPTNDVINNVENVYIRDPHAGSNYLITVTARRVNVNAVTQHTNDMVQDYALVISSGNGEFQDALTLTDGVAAGGNPLDLTVLSNTLTNDPGRYSGSFALNQHVGANSPILGSTTVLTNGQRSQWHFYVITNTTTFTNAAFVTFLPQTLAIPQIGVRQQDDPANATRVEADIDLYVSTDPALLDLDAAAIGNSFQARTRGGTEVVILTNSALNQRYFIGIKAEDQMAAEFSLAVLFSLEPFSATDDEGNVTLPFYPLGSNVIPDGSPASPQQVRFLSPGAIGSFIVRRVIATNSIFHENMGDLVGTLTHGQKFSVLNNHRSAPPGSYTFVYEDNDEDPNNTVFRHPDGPGQLRDFIGEQGSGAWFFNMVDNALTQTGSITGFNVRLSPSSSGGDSNIVHTVPAGGSLIEVVDVPVGATNLTVCVYNVSSGTQVPLELYIKRNDFPTQTDYDYFKIMFPPADCLTVTPADLPPLQSGRYYIVIYNPSAITQRIKVSITVGIDLASIVPVSFNPTNETPTLDDAVTNSTILVSSTNTIAQVEVGVRLQHPRVSDLALTLISPSGTRVLLTENRGGLDPEGMGGANAITNVFPQTSAGDATASTNVIDTGATFGFLTIDYNFFNVPDFMRVYYDGLLIFDTGLTNGARRVQLNYGPGSSTLVTIVMNEGNNTNNPTTAWTYTASSIIGGDSYLIFTDNTNRTTTPVKFLSPPFTPPPTGVISNICDFNTAAQGSYVMTQSVDGWSVLTSNRVAVFSEPGIVYSNNSFALLGGSVARGLPTTIGNEYRLNFAYRKAKFLDGLIGWWPGESNTVDIVGGDNGTPIPSAAYSPAVAGLGFDYDGTNQYTAVNGQFPFHTTNSASFEFWVKPRGDYGFNAYQCLFWTKSTVASDDNRFNFYIKPDSTFSFDYRNPGGLLFPLINDVPVASNDWTHIAITRLGAASYTVYTNGVVAANFVDANPDLPTEVGWRFSGLTYDEHEFNGVLDEISIYNRALTPFEVADIYAAGAAGKCGMITPPDVCPLAGASVSIPGFTTNSFLGTTNWTRGGLLFTAGTTNTPLLMTPAGGGRVYEFVRVTNDISWSAALVAAQTRVYAGVRGHLATITSAAENEFIRTNFSTGVSNELIWIAGRRTDTNGVWRWDAGPEVGRQFSSNAAPVAPYNYVNWAAGQPDNATTNEDYLVFNVGLDYGAVTNGQWADAPLDSGTTNPVVGYLVEYEPPNSGVYFDNFTLTELSDGLYVLPETSLDLLKGEPAGGIWTLEVLDRRTGATNASFVLKDWQLRFVYESSGPSAIPLQHGIPHTNTVPVGGVAYYIVDVPPWARFSTNSILFSSQPVNLWFNQTIPPLTGGGDVSFLANTTGGSYTIDAAAVFPPPDLIPGQRYYLAVENASAAPANFAIRVDFDITPLVNHIPQTNTLGLAFQKYYFYDVSTNATAVQYRLYNMNGNANLIARKGLPLPTLASYDIGSFNPGSFEEEILLFTNSQPVALSPGRWYLGVLPADITNVTYTIVADEFTNIFPAIITLTNRIPYTTTNMALGLDTDYYRFVVTTNAVRAQFEINNPSDDMTLLLRKGLPLPDFATFDYISANGYTNDEFIVVYTNSTPVKLSPGSWFLAAVNVAGVPVSYSIKASEFSAAEVGIGVVITNVFLGTNEFCMTWTSVPGGRYHVQGKPDLSATNWDNVSPTITATAYSTTWCIPLPSPYHFFRVAEGIAVSTNTSPTPIVTLTNAIAYFATNTPAVTNANYYRYIVSGSAARAQFEINGANADLALVARKGVPLPGLASFDYISTNSGLSDELIIVFTNSAPVALSPGSWYLAVVNLSGSPATYSVKATEWPTTGLPITVTSVQQYSNSICVTWASLPGVHYYVQGRTDLLTPPWVVVSPGILATGTSTTWCLPLPSPYNYFDVREGLVLSTFVFAPPAGLVVNRATNGFLLNWTGGPGQRYQVQWSGSLVPPAWSTFSNIITSTNLQYQFLDDGSQTNLGSQRLYRVFQLP